MTSEPSPSSQVKRPRRQAWLSAMYQSLPRNRRRRIMAVALEIASQRGEVPSVIGLCIRRLGRALDEVLQEAARRVRRDSAALDRRKDEATEG